MNFLFFQINVLSEIVFTRLSSFKIFHRGKLLKRKQTDGGEQKMVIFTIACCHGNSLQHTHMNESEISDVWLIFTVNARSLNPKLKQIVHF